LAIPRQFSTVDVPRAPEARLLACLREDYDSIPALRMMRISEDRLRNAVSLQPSAFSQTLLRCHPNRGTSVRAGDLLFSDWHLAFSRNHSSTDNCQPG